MPFGLSTKSVIVGIILGFFLLPMILGAAGSRFGRKTATA